METPFDPTRTALVVIDLQRDFCSPGGYAHQAGIDITRTQAVVANARRLLLRYHLLYALPPLALALVLWGGGLSYPLLIAYARSVPAVPDTLPPLRLGAVMTTAMAASFSAEAASGVTPVKPSLNSSAI